MKRWSMLTFVMALGCGGTDDGPTDPATGGSHSTTGGTGGATPVDAGPIGNLGDPCEDKFDCGAMTKKLISAKLESAFLPMCEEDALGGKVCTFTCQIDSASPTEGDKALAACGALGGSCTFPYGPSAHLCM